MAWALDIGTTNTGIARWQEQEERPRLVELPAICRRASGEGRDLIVGDRTGEKSDPLEAPRLVPSAVQLAGELGFWSHLGSRPFLAKRFFLGRLARIGRDALELNEAQPLPGFAERFKPALAREPLRPVARRAGRAYSARDVTRIFVRELFAEVKRTTGERIRDLVLTAPVDAYETYRAELLQITHGLGVKRVRFIDEPVAAALGYGLGLRGERHVLVVDFGGGTLDLALVLLTPKSVRAGSCAVIAKDGRGVGGDNVDHWLRDEFCERLQFRLPEERGDPLWVLNRLMLEEARRVKESVYFKASEGFYVTPPEELRSFQARLSGDTPRLRIDKDDLAEIMRRHGLYDLLETCVDSVVDQAAAKGIGLDAIDDVLLVGGSTLLPGIYPLFEERFGRDRVRGWQPFEAVAYGAAAFAADSYGQSDFIVHDYALVTHNLETHEPEYTVIIPRGTAFPTTSEFFRRQFVPTCSLGEPETLFKLLVAEIGRNGGAERVFGWDAAGNVHKLGGHAGDERLVVSLNDANPTLGRLNPPHAPRDRKPRLDIAFGVNAERWLCATVIDLETSRRLMADEPVVRLL